MVYIGKNARLRLFVSKSLKKNKFCVRKGAEDVYKEKAF